MKIIVKFFLSHFATKSVSSKNIKSKMYILHEQIFNADAIFTLLVILDAVKRIDLVETHFLVNTINTN